MKIKKTAWITNPKEFKEGERPRIDVFTESIDMTPAGWIYVKDIVVEFDAEGLLEVTRAISGGE